MGTPTTPHAAPAAEDPDVDLAIVRDELAALDEDVRAAMPDPEGADKGALRTHAREVNGASEDARRAHSRDVVARLGHLERTDPALGAWRDLLKRHGGLPAVAEFDPAHKAARSEFVKLRAAQTVVPLRGPRGYVAHRLNDAEYRQYPERLYGVTSGEDARQYSILPGHLSVSRVVDVADVRRDQTPGEVIDTFTYAEYRPVTGPSRTAVVSYVDMIERSPVWPTALTIGARVKSRGGIDSVTNAMRAMAQTAERDDRWGEGYAATGLLLRPDQAPAFLRQGAPAITADGFDPSTSVDLSALLPDLPGVTTLALDDPSTPGEQWAHDMATLARIVDTVPDQPYIPLVLLAALAWAPWSSDDAHGRFAAVIAGDSGALKTALCGLVVAAQSRTYVGGNGVEVPVTVKARHAGSSRIGSDRVLYPLRGMAVLLDDLFAGQLTGKEIHAGWEYLSAVADNTVTGAAGAKGTQRGNNVRADRYPRGVLIATAEALPDEDQHASEVNRLAALVLDSKIDTDALSDMQRSSRSLSRAHSGMIRAGLSDLDTLPREALAYGADTVREWNLSGHNRASATYARVMAGLFVFERRHRDAVGTGEGYARATLAEHAEAMREAADAQARRCGMATGRQAARDQVALFVRHLLALFAEGRVYAADPVKAPATEWDGAMRREVPCAGSSTYVPAEIPGWGPGATGWRQGGRGWSPGTAGDPIGAVHVRAPGGPGQPAWGSPTILRVQPRVFADLYGKVRQHVTDTDGWSLPSEDVMRSKLHAAGYLRSVEAQPVEVWADDKKARAYALDLGRMLDADGTPDQRADPPADDDDPRPDPPVDQAPDDQAPDDQAPDDQAPDEDPPDDTGGDDTGGDDTDAGDDTAAPERPPAAPPVQPRRDDTPATVAPAQGRDYGRVGVLDVDGLHTRDGRRDAAPANLADVYRLALAAQVRQVWVHPRAHAALGLPTAGDRVNLPLDAASPHPFAALAGLASDPGGVAPWVTVWSGGDRAGTSRSVAFPALDTRLPLADAADGPALLDAITAVNGALEHDYYYSPNETMRQLVGRHTRNLAPCRAVLDGTAAPAVEMTPDGPRPRRYVQMIYGGGKSRPLLNEEDAMTFVHALDLYAAELIGYTTWLGVGEPQRREDPAGLTFGKAERRLAGYWRLPTAPVGDLRLPALRCEVAPEGGVLVTTPDLALLVDLYGDAIPAPVGALVWPDSARSFDATYKYLRAGLNTLAPTRGTPSGGAAHRTVSYLYKSFIGHLAQATGPRHLDDPLWNPCHRDMMRAQPYANMYRGVARIGAATGRYPLAVSTDTAYYCSDESDPAVLMAQLGMNEPGKAQWKGEGVVPLAAIRRHAGEGSFKRAFDSQLKRTNGEG